MDLTVRSILRVSWLLLFILLASIHQLGGQAGKINLLKSLQDLICSSQKMIIKKSFLNVRSIYPTMVRAIYFPKVYYNNIRREKMNIVEPIRKKTDLKKLKKSLKKMDCEIYLFLQLELTVD